MQRFPPAMSEVGALCKMCSPGAVDQERLSFRRHVELALEGFEAFGSTLASCEPCSARLFSVPAFHKVLKHPDPKDACQAKAEKSSYYNI